MSNDDKFKAYIDSVITGKRIAGELELLSVQRHLRDLERTDWEYKFDIKKGRRAANFFKLLRHFKGEYAGKEFKLEGWQCFIVYSIFGWVKKSDGSRRFNYADIEVARKNGKTTFAAGIALYCMMLDGESGAEVYSAAVDGGQASICWGAAKEMAMASPQLSEFLQFYRGSIVMESTASSFKPLSKESKNKDGLNPHAAICDERHAWPNNDIYDVIKSGMGARKQPLVLSITTAGRNLNAPYFKDLRVLVDILRGVKVQDNQFVLIFQPDKDDDWKDPRTWEKANPNYGISVSPTYMAKELEDAINKGGTTEVNFKTKNLNIWVDAPDVWIPDEKVSKCIYKVDDNLAGLQCYAGLDLASHVDINCLCLYFPQINYFKKRYFVPSALIEREQDKVDYKEWRDNGYLTAFEGEMIDIEYLVSEIQKELIQYSVVGLAYDPYKAYHGVIQGLTNGGLSDILYEYKQDIFNMSEPAKEIQRLILSENAKLDDDPIIRWMFRNVVMYEDVNKNIRPNKRQSSGKIDGIVSMINAMGAYLKLSSEEDKNNMYNNHTLRVIPRV